MTQLAIAVALLAPLATTPAQHHGRVVGVIDGDTLTLLTADKRQIRVRLSCIDAPEKAQAFGAKAKQTLSSLVFGTYVTVLECDRDRYGRTVGDVVVAGVNVNKRMIELGLAWVYRQYCRDEAYLELERTARAAKAGLWRDAEPVPPWAFQRSKPGTAAVERKATPSAPGPEASTPEPFCLQMKRCSDMAACEARREIELCGTTSLDGDGDGVPCESLCREQPSRTVQQHACRPATVATPVGVIPGAFVRRGRCTVGPQEVPDGHGDPTTTGLRAARGRRRASKKAWPKKDSAPEDNQNWWTPDEEMRAISTIDSWREKHPRRRLVILTQVAAGMRFSEVRALEKRDLDLKVLGLWVRRSMARKDIGTPKNKRARFQVIPRALAQELQAWMLRTEGQLLFPGERGGFLANNSLNRWYRKLAEEAGVRPISSHGARHTTGSSFAFAGANQKMIATLLGHAHTGSTERYTHMRAVETQPLVEARWARLTNRDTQ